MSFIPWSEAIRQMRTLDHNDKAVPFDMEYVTLDQQRNTGGEIRLLNSVIVSGLKRKSKAKQHEEKVKQLQNDSSRHPNHFENSTLNLVDKQNNYTKIHLRLILSFNGKTVIY
jgi:hypothetical protein